MLVLSYGTDTTTTTANIGFTQKREKIIVSSGIKMLHITLSTDLIAGIGRILTGTCAEAQVKKGIWSIGFLITTL